MIRRGPSSAVALIDQLSTNVITSVTVIVVLEVFLKRTVYDDPTNR